jgi:nucleoside-diphosphate-sugar epimerase
MSKETMNVDLLVTGGAGRLGSEFVKIASSREGTIRVFDLPQAPWENVRDIHGVEILQGDITDSKQVFEACNGVDGVFHLAALLPLIANLTGASPRGLT